MEVNIQICIPADWGERVAVVLRFPARGLVVEQPALVGCPGESASLLAP